LTELRIDGIIYKNRKRRRNMKRVALLSLGGSSYSNISYDLGEARLTDDDLAIIVEDITYLKNVLADYVFGDTSTTTNEKKPEVVVPEWAKELQPIECKKCKSTNLSYVEGINKFKKPYSAFVCQDCKTFHFVSKLEPASTPTDDVEPTPAPKGNIHCKKCNGVNMRLDKKGYVYNGKKYDIYACLDCPPETIKGVLRPISTWKTIA
jgi:hypothetical protein